MAQKNEATQQNSRKTKTRKVEENRIENTNADADADADAHLVLIYTHANTQQRSAAKHRPVADSDAASRRISNKQSL